ncbi:MAG: FAD-dependent oxidoreductase [Cellvibrionaceae bacterium]
MPSNVLIIGAGVVGASLALALAEQGLVVTVIDKEDGVALGASKANGAQLSYSYTDAMASLEMLKGLPKLMCGLDPAFRFMPKIDLDFLRWGIMFLQNCSSSRSDRNTLAVLEVALRSSAIMNQWCEKYGFDFDHAAAKKLHLYDNRKAFEKAEERVLLKNQFGVNQSIISSEHLLDIEPALEYMNAELLGAVYSPNDCVGDASKFSRAALDKAMNLTGGELILNEEVKGFIKDKQRYCGVKTNSGDIEADCVVLCAGYQTRFLVRSLGQYIPLAPVAGYSLTYPVTEKTPNISLTDTTNKMVLCRVGERVRVAGMADVGRLGDTLPKRRIQTLKKILQHRFPLSADYNHEGQPWIGVRPMTPNSRPIIQQFRSSNLFLNCGHGMLGWTLAAGAADLMADKIAKMLRA